MFWQKDIELMPPEQLRELQTTRLRRSVAQAKKSPFYAKALAGVEPQSLNSPEDVRSLPFTVKKDMREHFPYGFLAVPRSQVVRLHASSGTTGTPTAILHSKADLRSWANLMARGLYMTGVRPSDVFQNLTGYGLFSGGLGMHYAAERLGTMVIPAGAGNSPPPDIAHAPDGHHGDAHHPQLRPAPGRGLCRAGPGPQHRQQAQDRHNRGRAPQRADPQAGGGALWGKGLQQLRPQRAQRTGGGHRVPGAERPAPVGRRLFAGGAGPGDHGAGGAGPGGRAGADHPGAPGHAPDPLPQPGTWPPCCPASAPVAAPTAA